MSAPSSAAGEAAANAGAGLSLDVGDDGIAVLEFDQPDADNNRFTPELLARFVTLAGEIRTRAEDGEIFGVVLASGKRGSFIVGMDVETIARVSSAQEGATGAREGQRAFQLLAELPVSTVAAINGTCVGGATEMALACDFRLASDDPAVDIGLPEVNLGIIPGFGGTQRLPRRISLERALPMILTGKGATAARAYRIGLVDAVVPAALLMQQARSWARRPKPGQRRVRAPEDRSLARRLRRALLEGQPLGRALVFRQAAASVRAAGRGHYPAPEAALAVVRRGLRGSLAQGLEREAAEVGRLVVSDVARSLMGIFFLRQAARRAGSGSGSGAGAGTGADPVIVRRLGVLGAGVMGGGIAQLAAYQGVSARVKDIATGPLEQAMGVAFRRFEERRRAGKLDAAGVARGMGLISTTLAYDGFGRADLIIEAVVENVEVKHQVLAAAEAAAGPDTVLATNTSSLTVESRAGALRDPSRFVGLHFFNPVHRMPLVEVVRGPESGERAVATAAAFAVAMGKVPVVVGDAPGFFVNRVLSPYLNEALLLLQEGASVAAVDRALEQFGMPMGPLRLLDEIGLDVSGKVAAQLGPVFGDRVPTAEAAQRVLASGRLGRKGGAGFYRYPATGKPAPDPEVARLLGSTAAGSAPAAADIVDRCILALLNEAFLTLEEGVVASPMAADLALVLGIGFAPFRGGVFRYAQTRGLERIRARMGELAAKHGRRFEPASGLAAAGDDFAYPTDWPRKVDTIYQGAGK